MTNYLVFSVFLILLGLGLIAASLFVRHAEVISVIQRLTHSISPRKVPREPVRNPFREARTKAVPHTQAAPDLYIYQIDPASKEIRAKTGLRLPTDPGEYSEVLPPHGKGTPEAFDSVRLASTPTINTVSHNSPLKVYMGLNEKFYIEVNKNNYNPSKFNGHTVVDDPTLDDVAKADENGARRLFFLANEALIFAYNTQKAPSEDEGVILDNYAFEEKAESNQPQAGGHHFAH